jgi:hypothetical protein
MGIKQMTMAPVYLMEAMMPTTSPAASPVTGPSYTKSTDCWQISLSVRTCEWGQAEHATGSPPVGPCWSPIAITTCYCKCRANAKAPTVAGACRWSRRRAQALPGEGDHSRRVAIEQLLQAGVRLGEIGQQYGLSATQLRGHKRHSQPQESRAVPGLYGSGAAEGKGYGLPCSPL